MPRISQQKDTFVPRVHLRLAREAAGMSQGELAEKLGTGQVSVSRWESGLVTPSPYFRERLCHIFGRKPGDLDLERNGQTLSLYDPLIPSLPVVVVGRSQEHVLLRTYVCNPETTETIITGLPGVGKTTLAVVLAHDREVHASFEGILWAGLGPKPDVNGQLSRWANLLGLPTEQMSHANADSIALALRSIIGRRRMLLILDDVWEIEDALAFKVGGPFCTHLLTTRFPTIAKQMTLGDPMLLHELSEEWSLDLLHRLAPSVIEREPTKAQSLVQAVGGLPLALTLAGNYLRLQTGQSRRVQEALERLSDAQARLHLSEVQSPAERRPGLAPSRSLHAIIAVSDERLPVEVRDSLYALSVLPPKPDSFSEEAALAVCNCSTSVLDTLVDGGLLEIVGDDRYTLHQSIADYAHAHLATTEPYERLIEYASELVETHQTNYELLERESSIIVAALDVAYEQEKKTDLIRISCAFAPFLIMRGNYSVAEEHLRRAHTAALEADDHQATIPVCLYLGDLAGRQGEYQQSLDILRQGLILARQKDSKHISELLSVIGHGLGKLGEYKTAISFLEEGLALARAQGLDVIICQCLTFLGTIADYVGEVDRSEAYLREGLTLARHIGDRQRICRLLLELGTTMAIQGGFVEAEMLQLEGLALARHIGNIEYICIFLSNMGELERIRKNFQQAEIFLQEGLTHARHIGLSEWASALLINLAEVCIDQRNYHQAMIYLDECEHSNARVNATLQFFRGMVALLTNNHQEAEHLFFKMQPLIPPGDLELQAMWQYAQARMVAIQGNVLEAFALGEGSVAYFEKQGHYRAKEIRAWLQSLTV